MLRDKFAMAAMQSIIERVVDGTPDNFIAEQSYRVADAMMKERANWDFSGDPVPPLVPAPPIE